MRNSNMLLKVCIKCLAAGPLAVCVVIGDGSAWKHNSWVSRLSRDWRDTRTRLVFGLMLKPISSAVPPGSPSFFSVRGGSWRAVRNLGQKGFEVKTESALLAEPCEDIHLCVFGPSPSCFIKAAERRSRDGAFACWQHWGIVGQTQEHSSSWEIKHFHTMLSNYALLDWHFELWECLRSGIQALGLFDCCCSWWFCLRSSFHCRERLLTQISVESFFFFFEIWIFVFVLFETAFLLLEFVSSVSASTARVLEPGTTRQVSSDKSFVCPYCKVM